MQEGKGWLAGWRVRLRQRSVYDDDHQMMFDCLGGWSGAAGADESVHAANMMHESRRASGA